MRGIPVDIGGNSMPIPPEICPGVGDFPQLLQSAVAEWLHVGLVVKRSGVRSPAVLPNL